MHFCGVCFQHLCSMPEDKKNKSGTDSSSGTELKEALEKINADEEDKVLAHPEKGEKDLKTESESEKAEGGKESDKGVNEPDGNKFKGADILDEEKEDLGPEAKKQQKHQEKLRKAKLFMIFLCVTNLIPALYFCLIHQRGTVMVTKFLSDEANKNPNADVLFLMPCHSTPYYSYLHQNISLRFLTCEPNLKGESNYIEEADAFYSNPNSWLLSQYTVAKKALPSHLVFFNVLHKEISPWMTQSGYKLCEKYFHTHLPEGRVGSYVFVSCR